MSERDAAIKLANKVLDTPYRDPDDDLSMMSRQFLCAIEPQWQSIKTAPKNGTWVLAFIPESIQSSEAPKPLIEMTRWVIETWEHWECAGPDTKIRVVEDSSHWSNYEPITHWMLPPDPPKD